MYKERKVSKEKMPVMRHANATSLFNDIAVLKSTEHIIKEKYLIFLPMLKLELKFSVKR